MREVVGGLCGIKRGGGMGKGRGVAGLWAGMGEVALGYGSRGGGRGVRWW